MPTPQPSRQHNKQITLIMKNNHLKIAVNKESKMLFKKLNKYNFKKLVPMTMLAVSPIVFNSCSKDETTKYDITFIWGIDRQDDIYPVTKIQQAASNEEVNSVILESDGQMWGGIKIELLYKGLLKDALAVSPKVKLAGIINGTQVKNEQDRQDSIKIVNAGAKFGTMFQKQH
jgi:hypothetical protein